MADLTVPTPYTARPCAADDAAAVAELLNIDERAHGGHPGVTTAEVRSIVEATVGDPVTDTRVVLDPAGDLVAVGTVGTPPPGGTTMDMYGCVHPDRTGAGIGRELLGWQVARAGEIAAGRPAGVDWEFEVAANTADTASARLFARFGFAAARYFFEMAAKARDGVGAPVPAGLTVTGYDPAEERRLYDTHTEAFADHWGSQKREFDKWVTYTTRNDDFRPDLCRLAFDGDELVGYVLPYGDADPDRIYIGQVGTRRPWRRRGLAAALLAEVLGAAAAAGKAVVYLGVDAASPTGAVGVYERVGFAVSTRSAVYRRPA